MGSLALDKHIYVIDPEPDFYSVIKRELKRMDYHLVFLEDIKSFFKRLSRSIPFMIILNINIEGGRGIQFLKILRDSHKTSSLPIIVLSENLKKVDAVQLMRYRVDDFLTKNLDTSTYIQRIIKVIKRYENPEESRLETENGNAGIQVLERNNGNGRKPRLLIVEDDPNQAKFIRFAVESRNYEVFVAENGVEGLEKVREFFPDLVILDIMMPMMDGLEVCRRIRSDPEIEDTPIIIVSVLAEVHSRVEGLQKGADDYLPKPYEIKELLARIEALLRRAGRGARQIWA